MVVEGPGAVGAAVGGDPAAGLEQVVALAQREPVAGHRRPVGFPFDRMVDLALDVEGVVGAQLAGAGLGGSMMVLARSDAVSRLRASLRTHYYEPYGQPPAMLLCEPIAGSGVLLMDDSR